MSYIGTTEIGKIFLGATEISKAYLGNSLVFQEGSSPEPVETMTLIRHWDGTDAPTSSRWYDKIGNQYWTLTNATHEGYYYEFLNSAPRTATARGQLNGALPDLCYHWKIIANVEVKVDTSATSMVAFDFGSIGSVESGKCAVACYLSVSSQQWNMGAKFNGNSSSSTYNPDGTNLVDPDFANNAWIHRTITVGVKESSTPGKDVAYMNVSDVGYGETATPFDPIRFDRWESNVSYIARSRINTSSKYKYSTNVRIYDIKVYYEPVT